MAKTFKKPDLKAPRFREKSVQVLQVSLYKKFRKKYPEYNIDYDQFKEIIYTYNKDIAVALLKLEKLAELHADCYFRTYNAANDRNENAYSATSECFSDVKQQESDLEIYLKEFSQELTTFMRSGYH